MSLLAGIISAAGEPAKIGSFSGNFAVGSILNTAMSMEGASSGQMEIVLHYAVFPNTTTPTAPSTPSNFTSLKSGTQNNGVSANFGYRISYRIFSSTVSTITLPATTNSSTSQLAVGLVVTPVSGYSFSGLSIAEENTSTFTSSVEIGTLAFSAGKNDIGLGVLYGAYNGSNPIPVPSTSTNSISFGNINFTNPGGGVIGGQMFAGLDVSKSARTINITGVTIPSGASMYALQLLRPTFA